MAKVRVSKAQVAEIEFDWPCLGWEEITGIAGHLFAAPENGPGGLRWAQAAWRVLSAAGLDRYIVEVDRIVCILRFIALYALYSEFRVRVFGECGAEYWEHSAADGWCGSGGCRCGAGGWWCGAGAWERTAPSGLIGDYPLIDAFSLGQLAQQRDMFVNNTPDWYWDVRREVIALQAKVEYRQVLQVLQDRWGKNELFTALCASLGTTPATPSPCDAEPRSQAFGAISRAGIRRAWTWYDAGASPERPVPPARLRRRRSRSPAAARNRKKIL